MTNNTTFRLCRGGGWYGDPQGARVAFRDYDTPDFRDSSLGVRLVESHKETEKMIRMHDQVTNSQWREFRPSHTFTKGHDNKPVVNVTYDEAMEYAAWLSKKTGRKFRLPTEDERMNAEATFVADFSNHPLKECPDVETFGMNADGVTGLLGVTYDWCLHVNDYQKAKAAWEDGSPAMKEAPSKVEPVVSVTTPEPTEPTANPQENLVSLLTLIERRDALQAELADVEKYIAAANNELARIGLKL